MIEWIDCSRTEAESELAAGRRVRVKMILPHETAPRWVTVAGAGLPCSPRKCHGLQREASDQVWTECTQRIAKLRLAHGRKVEVYNKWSDRWENAVPSDFGPMNTPLRFRCSESDMAPSPAHDPELQWNPAPARKAHAMWKAGIRVQFSSRVGHVSWFEVTCDGSFEAPNRIFRFARV